MARDGGGNAVSNLGDAVGGAVGDLAGTGSGSGSGGGSTQAPDPVKQLTKDAASVACLAEVGVSTLTALLGGKLTPVPRLHGALRLLRPRPGQ